MTERRDQPRRLRGAARRGVRLEVPDGPRHRRRPALPRARPGQPDERLVENKLTRKSLFGIAGVFYQRGQDYPFPLLGLQYFNFDMWGKNKQLSVFFAGALLFANYTDPAFLRHPLRPRRRRLRRGVPVRRDELPQRGRDQERADQAPARVLPDQHRPSDRAVPQGVGRSSRRSTTTTSATTDTGPEFVTPVDTFTYGAGARLNWNQDGYNIAAHGGYYSRAQVGAVGRPGDVRTTTRARRTTGSTRSTSNQGLLLRQLPQAARQARLPRRPGPRPVLAVGLRPVLDQRPHRVSRAAACSPTAPSWPTSRTASTSRTSFASSSSTTRRSSPTASPGYDNTYFSGVGITTAFNGPWDNTRIRADVGYPVVAQGVKGFTINAQILKLF